jgi:hypothetical protein
MGKSILQLNFPETSNEGVFLIDDISIYDPNLTTISTATSSTTTSTNPCTTLHLPCGNLQITPPGFISPTILNIDYSNFRLVLNSCTMGLSSSTACADSCPTLPDGLYNIRYSISPNDKVYVEYKLLRIVQAMNRYYSMLCKIGLSPCLPGREQQYELQSLFSIKQMIQAAKSMVENEHQFTDGVNMYRFAVGLMDKMSFEPNRC